MYNTIDTTMHSVHRPIMKVAVCEAMCSVAKQVVSLMSVTSVVQGTLMDRGYVPVVSLMNVPSFVRVALLITVVWGVLVCAWLNTSDGPGYYPLFSRAVVV